MFLEFLCKSHIFFLLRLRQRPKNAHIQTARDWKRITFI